MADPLPHNLEAFKTVYISAAVSYYRFLVEDEPLKAQPFGDVLSAIEACYPAVVTEIRAAL